MEHPKRIQRKRTKGWRMPEGAVYVGRGSKWGNPFPLSGFSREEALRRCKLVFAPLAGWVRQELRGKDLACWCGPDQKCHADILLEIANGESPPAKPAGVRSSCRG